ncbi:protein NTM1-like 9 isoform X4 [Rhodamnia argentea]|uniref:Protein NTM1-like 9 isoform X4 n=1 Tax=Rhodamnia argentea TaxID=178133 RepID=A0A8B8PU16_9MYRT|nr:protein NTM1-like 9 isoform X4 [Rhodamnia argentea]
MGEWAEAWPVGLRFKPTEYELVRHHLTRKLRGEIEAICLIPELYIYDWEPPELFARYNELSSIPSDGSECFFFCPHRHKRKRKTECGFWKETCTKRVVQAPDTGEEIGLRRSLVYHTGRQRNARRTNLSMYEYHLKSNVSDSAIPDPMALVLCHITNRKSERAKSATASTSTDLSGPCNLDDSETPEISAQASPGVTAEFPYPDETSDFDLPDRNVPAPDQQPQTSEEQRLSYDDHRPYSPSDGINLVDLLNFDEGTDSMPNQSDNASV